MLTWFAVALAGGAGAVAAGWSLRRFDELGRPRRLPWVGVSLLLAMAVAAAIPGCSGPTRNAVHVLTHEAMHLSGRLNEAAAECAAVQRDTHTARLLGAPDAAAAELAAAHWRDVYPLMPDGYRSADCRPGGPLDERLADAPWLARTSS